MTEIWQVDAFTDRPFKGNPAAVCILDSYPDAAWMQAVATEMNLSETAFIAPGDQTGQFDLRWFTPANEVDLCGHATLASAHLLFELSVVMPGDTIQFQTLSGPLTCRSTDGLISLDFPSLPADQPVNDQTLAKVGESLNTRVIQAMKSSFDMIVELESENALRAVKPDFNRMIEMDTRGVCITAKSDQPDQDFVSRFFAPRHGINEDPVTGSAHCMLAPFWAERLGKNSTIGFQASRRGGTVHCRLNQDRVLLSGPAVTVMKGQLLPPPNTLQMA